MITLTVVKEWLAMAAGSFVLRYDLTLLCQIPMLSHVKSKSKEKKKQKNVSFFFSLETLDFTIRIDSTPTFLYFDLYL